MNPGPTNKQVWPCGICEYPVTWSQYGIACDGCDVWHHKSCLSMCTQDYKDLERSHVAWKCCKCDSMNCDSFTFRSYELQISNSFQPLSLLDSTIDSLKSDCFSPLHTSSPRTKKLSPKSKKSNNSTCNRKSSYGNDTNSDNKKSQTTHSDYQPFADLPNKQNLRIMNVNCRSVKENCSEFKAAVSYIKPDIICGTESWLKGIRPGKTPSGDHIKNSEIFPENYTVFRNDRGTRGGGVL